MNFHCVILLFEHHGTDSSTKEKGCRCFIGNSAAQHSNTHHIIYAQCFRANDYYPQWRKKMRNHGPRIKQKQEAKRKKRKKNRKSHQNHSDDLQQNCLTHLKVCVCKVSAQKNAQSQHRLVVSSLFLPNLTLAPQRLTREYFSRFNSLSLCTKFDQNIKKMDETWKIWIAWQISLSRCSPCYP